MLDGEFIKGKILHPKKYWMVDTLGCYKETSKQTGTEVVNAGLPKYLQHLGVLTLSLSVIVIII